MEFPQTNHMKFHLTPHTEKINKYLPLRKNQKKANAFIPRKMLNCTNDEKNDKQTSSQTTTI